MKNPTKANLSWEAQSPKLRAGAKEELLKRSRAWLVAYHKQAFL